MSIVTPKIDLMENESLISDLDDPNLKCAENSVLTVQQALKAPSLDPTLKISDALFSLRQLVLTGGLQPTPEHELLALRGEKS